MKKILIIFFTVTILLEMAEYAKAIPVTFTGSSGSLAASVTFDSSGTNLLVTLVNTSTGDPSAPGDILTGVIFSIPGNPLLDRSMGSAKLSVGSIVIHGPVPATDPGGVVGGEWAYTNSLAGAFVGQQAIYSAGYFDGLARFLGSNLEGPPSGSVDGVQYGISTLFDLYGNDNGGIKNMGLIRNSVDFVLPGLPAGFKLSDISNVSFQYGTGLDETNFPGVHAPEPSTMLLLGSGLVGLAGYGRRKFFKK
jgi:PEP-CTERM motif